MSQVRLRYLAILAILVGLGTSACWQRVTPPAPDSAGGVYEQAGYNYFRWKEGLAVMVWQDATATTSCNSFGSTDDPTHTVQCQAISETGQEVIWQLETDDGRTATFSINNQTYDLADGTVFLVKTAVGHADIQQLQRDLSTVQAENDSITQYSLSDSDIEQFIQSVPAN